MMRERGCTRERGYTLVEVLVTAAIVALGAAMAVPSFQATIDNQRLRDGEADLRGDLQLARTIALSTGAPVGIAATTRSYTLFIDNGAGGGTARDGQRNGGEAVIDLSGSQVLNPDDNAVKNATRTLGGRVRFAPETFSFLFAGSGRRILPPPGSDFTLTSASGGQRIIHVTDIGEVRTF